MVALQELRGQGADEGGMRGGSGSSGGGEEVQGMSAVSPQGLARQAAAEEGGPGTGCGREAQQERGIHNGGASDVVQVAVSGSRWGSSWRCNGRGCGGGMCCSMRGGGRRGCGRGCSNSGRGSQRGRW